MQASDVAQQYLADARTLLACERRASVPRYMHAAAALEIHLLLCALTHKRRYHGIDQANLATKTFLTRGSSKPFQKQTETMQSLLCAQHVAVIFWSATPRAYPTHRHIF